MARIVVVGSSNTDMVVKTERIPGPGETVIGEEFVMAGGGKGANQAVAAARLGGQTTLVARVGNDIFGERALDSFRAEGIDTRFIVKDPDTPSGVALIFVDRYGENVIVVAPGANHRLTREDVERAKPAIQSADVLLLQLEIPLDTVIAATRIAHLSGRTVVLNPAPARDLPLSLLEMIDVLTPNQTEAALLAGMDPYGIDVKEAAERILGLGVSVVAITMGSEGAFLLAREGSCSVPAPCVEAVDSTAAGDAFNAALAVALAEGKDIKEAAEFAVRAGAISVTRMGAQPSLPTRAEVDSFGPDQSQTPRT